MPGRISDTKNLVLFSLNESDHWDWVSPGVECKAWDQPQV